MQTRKLVLFPGALGDFLCFYPALQWLRRSEADALVEVRVRGDLGALLCARDASLAVGRLESPEVSALFVTGAYRDPAVRNFYRRYDEIYSWTGYNDETFRQNVTALASSRAQLFAFRPKTACGGIAEYYMTCAGGERKALEHLLLPVRPRARAWVEAYLRERGIADAPLLALAPGSGAKQKNWPTQHFAAISEWWRRFGFPLLIVGPAERERAQGAEVMRPGPLTVEGLSLDQLAALFARCRAMLGNDSGPTHLAAAVGVPTFAIFGPTDRELWRPWGPRVTAIHSSLPCAPCGLSHMRECAHQNCLTELRPERVIRIMTERIDLRRTGPATSTQSGLTECVRRLRD